MMLKLTTSELIRLAEILTQAGKISDASRHEFLLLSDVMGLTMVVDYNTSQSRTVLLRGIRSLSTPSNMILCSWREKLVRGKIIRGGDLHLALQRARQWILAFPRLPPRGLIP